MNCSRVKFRLLRATGALGCALLGTGILPAQLTFNATPSRIVGQARLRLSSGAPNLVEGREFNQPQGIAIDTTLSPPALYVSDTGNNRVLGFRNAASFQSGAKADIVIGQPDMFSTAPLGPGTAISASGLNTPTGLAVDSQGNLYVGDSGNNRILRFPKPFSQPPTDLQTPDFLIGQKNFNSNSVNGGGTVNANVIATAASSVGAAITTLLFDSQGNLWFTDSFNNRVIRYPAASLGGSLGPAADLVLGQPNLTSNTIPATMTRQVKSTLGQPQGLVFDAAGRLFVTDYYNRALVYAPPFTSGASAVRILGVVIGTSTNPAPLISEGTLGTWTSSSILTPPGGMFLVGQNVWITDPGYSRVLRFDPYDQWQPESALFSPPAKGVLGQLDFVSGKANNGQPTTNEGGLYGAAAGVVYNNELYLTDTGNNRVLVFPVAGAGFGRPSRVLGQDNLVSGSINLIEGREFYFYQATKAFDGAGLAIDTKSNPPRLYVSDTYNHRILGYRDARNIRPGDKADLVIGQPDFTRAVPNYPLNDSTQPQATTLFLPKGIVVDSSGALWVADQGNGRVLRFPSPFDQPAGQMPRANLVIGQRDFTGAPITDPTSRNMALPYGIAFTTGGDLLVSDSGLNRVLFFRKPAGSDFTNGQQAEKVFGQADFFGFSAGSDLNKLSSPRQIAVDADDHLYITDAGNARVVVYDRPGNSSSGSAAAKSITSFSDPRGVYISPVTGEVWVADFGGNKLYRFQSYDNLLAKPDPQASLVSNAPLAVTLDSFGNLIAAESVNRVAFYFPGVKVQNGANFSFRPVAPGMIASLFPVSSDANALGSATEAFKGFPAPLELGDVQVFVNDLPSPMFLAYPRQINFVVPQAAPTSGTADMTVIQKSTGRVLAATTVQMATSNPALFTADASGSGQVSAINYHRDGSVDVNSQSKPAAWGDTVQLYGTGAGPVPGAPPDGVAVSGLLSTPSRPRIFLGTGFIDDSNITFSGLAPELVGVWVINFKVPDLTGPGQVQVIAILNSIQTNIDATGKTTFTSIWVKAP